MRVKANAEIRNLIQSSNLTQWEVAEAIGVTENTVYRWLRTPLTPYREQLIYDAIRELIKDA